MHQWGQESEHDLNFVYTTKFEPVRETTGGEFERKTRVEKPTVSQIQELSDWSEIPRSWKVVVIINDQADATLPLCQSIRGVWGKVDEFTLDVNMVEG